MNLPSYPKILDDMMYMFNYQNGLQGTGYGL
jgi:hypothetical protein